MATTIQVLSARTLSWALAALALFAALPVLGAVLTVTPASGGTGASVKVNASGLTPSTSYVLEFVGNPATNIATLTTDARGAISTTRVLPALPPGTGKMRLKTTGLGGVVVGYTAFTALGGLTFTPQGTTFHAGQSIRFTVGGLVAGTVTVLYENEAVTGPVTVSRDTYSGRFAIPTDRPARLPANARIRVLNKVGRVVVNQLDTTMRVLTRLASPFNIGYTQPPLTQPRSGQRFNVRGNVNVFPNEAVPDDVSLWYFGDNGDVYPLGSAQMAGGGGNSLYTVDSNAPSVVAMTAGQSAGGRVRMVGSSSDTFGRRATLQQSGTDTAFQQLPLDRWRLVVRVRKTNGEPIPGAIVQIEGAPIADPESGESNGGSLWNLVNTSTLASQLVGYQVTDDQGCPITLSRKVANDNGIVVFEFDEEELRLNGRIEGVIVDGGGIGPPIVRGGNNGTWVPKIVRLAIDASAQGHGFQFTDGPDAGDFLPHIYEIRFDGVGDGDTSNDAIAIIDWYQDVEMLYEPDRDATYTLGLPPITPKVALFDVAAKPWIGSATNSAESSDDQSWAATRQVFGPITRVPTAQPYAGWVTYGGEAYPTQITVRTDPAVTGVIPAGNARLYLDMNRNGDPEQVATFSASVQALDCTIDGLDKSLTWRATLPASLRSAAPGVIKGYVKFIGANNSGQAIKKIGVNMIERSFAWLNEPGKYSQQKLVFADGGQRLEIEAVENTPDEAIQLPSNPGYEIGRLRNETNNQRLITTYIARDGGTYASTPIDGTHQQAGRGGDSTLIDTAVGVTYGPETTTLIDQSIPLFYYTWGVPMLAGVEIGADFSLLAEITMGSRVDLTANKEPRLTLSTTPSIDMGLNFYIDLDILFDLVDGEVDLTALFEVDMPIRVVNGVNQDITPDFDASLLLSWRFEIWCLPFDPICNAIPSFDDCERLLPTNDNRPCPDFDAPSSPLAAQGFTPQGVTPVQSALAYSRSGAGLMAFTRPDPAQQSPPRLVVRPIDGGDFTRLPDETILSTAPGIRSVAIEYYDDERAVAVWAENADTYAVMATRTAAQRLARQRLMYATWDGETWSTKRQLTPVSGGEGGVDLASCQVREDADCPANGEVLAVWTRDMAGDILQHRTRVYSSRFDPVRGWTTPQPVDAAALLDSAPSAAYVDAVPAVAFVRSTSGVFADTAARRVAYRFLQSGTTVQVPAGLPGGVAWPSIIATPDGGFAIAHTHGENGRAFVSNRHRAAMAFANACSAGSCAVVAQAVTDANGRPVYGERPTALLDGEGNVAVVMRGTGFGPGPQGTEPLEGDPLGMVAHTGELISYTTARGQAVIQPLALSNDGAGYFAPTAAFDPELGQIVATATRTVEVPFGLRSKYAKAGVEAPPARASAVAGEDNMVVYSAEQGVDFAIEEITTNASTLTGGSTVQVTVKLRNVGGAFTAQSPFWQMVLSMDSPRDAGGTTFGGRFIPSLAPGQLATLVSNIVVPAGFSPDEAHRLYAQVVRGPNPVEDVNNTNDVAHKDFGGMPMPFALSASAVPGTRLVQLTWDPIEDPTDLIAGYRVWFHDGDGEWKHLGSSFNLGFLDLNAPIGVQRHYRVTSYSRKAIESPPSSEAVATATLNDGVFANGFE